MSPRRGPRAGREPGAGGTGPTRRRFLVDAAAAGIGSTLLAREAVAAATFLRPLRVMNPLTGYPNRGWEKVYRDLYQSDSSFVFLCAPNDTHNCLLRGFVKNGVVTRIAPTYGYHRATDLAGNRASRRWDPRCCQKGLALVRRFYGDRRCKRPLVREGFKRWVDDGFPRHPETGAVDPKYMRRGEDGLPAGVVGRCLPAGRSRVSRTSPAPTRARRAGSASWPRATIR